MPVLSIKVNDALAAQIEEISGRLGVTKSELVRRSLALYITLLGQKQGAEPGSVVAVCQRCGSTMTLIRYGKDYGKVVAPKQCPVCGAPLRAVVPVVVKPTE